MEYELVLDHNYNKIAQDLDVFEIKDYIKELEKSKILQPWDIQKIFNCDGSNDNITRAKTLLDIFKTRLQNNIRGFIEHLKTPYRDLAQDFLNDLKTIKDIDELPTTKKHIRRLAALNEVKQHLKLSTTFVVIYGMPGMGKTNLAVEAAMHFALQKKVYWVNAGGAAGSELKVLRTLLSRVKPKQGIQDSQSDPMQLASLLKGTDMLKEDDLVILDNVTKDVDLSIFKSLPPKFIITTSDRSIMEDLDSPEKIDMNQGFSKEESLELISKVVKKEVRSLPPYVANIHKYFQGYPLAVTLIAGQLAHCPECDWSEYCQFSDDLETSGNNHRRRSTDGFVRIDSTMQKCIQSLSPENQYYYKMLAIFKDNVYLTQETLQVLWGAVKDIKDEKYKVRDILNELENKSMVIKNYRVSLETSVYEIHSTVLNYLRRRELQSEDDIKKTHEKFVNNYVSRYRNIADIQDDHYIFYYIIYHIISAGVLQDFRSQLFTLDYIMAKLVACGPNDMAEDLKMYKNKLEEAGFDKQRLEETAEFSERFGWDIYHTKVKDMQFFLQMPEDSLLFKEAMNRCNEYNHLVLKSEWITPSVITKEYPFQSVVKKLFCLERNEILCEKWTEDRPFIVLVKLGDVKETVIANGSILCICVETGKMLYKDGNNTFLKQVGGGRTPDTTRQMNGNGSFFGPAASNGTPITKCNDITIAAFSQSGDKIVFASNTEKGVYYLQDDKLSTIPKTDDAPIPTPKLCSFCWVHNSEVVMFATMDRQIYFYETASLDLIRQYDHRTKIVDMTPIPNKRELLILSEMSGTILSWEHGPQRLWRRFENYLTIGELTPTEIYDGPNKCLKCFAIGRWIAIATSDGCAVKANAKEQKFFRVGYGEVAALDIVDNTLTIVTSRKGSCKDSSVGRISVYNLQEHERGQPRPYLTDACQRWSLQKGYRLGIVEPGNVEFYNAKKKIFEAEIPEPISIAMSRLGDIAAVGDAQKRIHHILPCKEKIIPMPERFGEPVNFLKMDPSGKFIVAGSTIGKNNSSHGTSYPFYIIDSRKIIRDGRTRSPVVDCFFEEEHSKHVGADPNVSIVCVFKNGFHLVYDPAKASYSYSEDDNYEAYGDCMLSCAAYHNYMLIKGVGTSLHVFNLKEQKFHKSKDFRHRITSCCIEPHEQQSAADSTKPWVAVALAKDDPSFLIVVCCKDLNELLRIDLDYAQEEIQQLVFSKSQMILMARCDWLCFWDVGDSYKSTSTKTTRSTLHAAWKNHPKPLNTKDKLLARFKLQLEVLSLLPYEDFSSFAVVHKKGDRRFLSVVDYDDLNIYRNGSLRLDLKSPNGSS